MLCKTLISTTNKFFLTKVIDYSCTWFWIYTVYKNIIWSCHLSLKELKYKKNCKLQEKMYSNCFGEKPIVKYRPFFIKGLELDAFFQYYRMTLEVQKVQYRLHNTSWYKDVKLLEVRYDEIRKSWFHRRYRVLFIIWNNKLIIIPY